MKRLLSIAFFLLAGLFTVSAQDSLLLLTGKVLEGRVISEDDQYVTYVQYYADGDSIIIPVETYRVFSIKSKGGEERVLYVQDEASGNLFKPEEMRYYIYGEQDADKNYSAWATGIGGFVTGAAAGWFIQDGFPYVLAQPFVYAGFNLLPFISIKPKHVRNAEMLQHEPYVAGFERVARNRKVQAALKGSLAGMAVGIAGAVISNSAN